MRKVKYILVIMLCSIVLSGCGLFKETELYKDTTLPNRISTQQGEAIMNCLKTGESDELKSYFCKAVSDSHNLDAEIDEALKFIEGKIISDGTWRYFTSSETSWREGEETLCTVSPSIVDIQTDAGEVYQIHFHAYVICKENKDYVGITYISISKKDVYDTDPEVQIGEYVY